LFQRVSYPLSNGNSASGSSFLPSDAEFLTLYMKPEHHATT
jgi:hypothetical protein